MNVLDNNAKYIPLFDKYTVKANQDSIPEIIKGLDKIGGIAFTIDQKKKGILNKFFYFFQMIHGWFTGRKAVRYDISHGVVITGRNNESQDPDNLNIVHAVVGRNSKLGGIRTANTNYLKNKEVTEMVIYLPKTEKLRNIITTNALRNSCAPEKYQVEENKNNKPMCYSIKDLITSFFFKNRRHETQIQKISQAVKEQLAYLVTDLLRGEQIRDKDGNLRSFFCSAYAMSILQGSLLIEALSNDEKNELDKIQDRHQVAAKILSYFNDSQSNHSIAQTFRNNKICRLDGRYIMSSYAEKTLDKFSINMAK